MELKMKKVWCTWQKWWFAGFVRGRSTPVIWYKRHVNFSLLYLGPLSIYWIRPVKRLDFSLQPGDYICFFYHSWYWKAWWERKDYDIKDSRMDFFAYYRHKDYCTILMGPFAMNIRLPERLKEDHNYL